MAFQDELSREEKQFLAKVFGLEIEYFNRDLRLLLNNAVEIFKPAVNYLTRQQIYTHLNKRFVRITSRWEGDCSGESFLLINIAEAKVLYGYFKKLSPEVIKGHLKEPFTPADVEGFQDIAQQLNDSMSNALREHFDFNVRITIKKVRVETIEEGHRAFEAIFTHTEYLQVNSVLKPTAFSIGTISHYLPRELITLILEKQGLHVAAVETPAEGPKEIMIVDDDPSFRTQVIEVLAEHGITAQGVNDGIEAMQVLIRKKVHMIILDMEMPNLSGVETCERIKQNIGTRNIPVIMCSSESTREKVLAAVNCGARDFIVKPITDKAAFLEKINKYI